MDTDHVDQTVNYEDIVEKLEAYGQSHLLEYLKVIPDEEKKAKYLSELNNIDYLMLKKLYSLYQSSGTSKEILADDITPIESYYRKDEYEKESNAIEREEMYSLGLSKVYEGKVALLILAGGQGSRLGFNKAKGMYDISMPSKKSLFEYLCNRFLSVQNLSLETFEKEQYLHFQESTLFIMTSLENHNETVEFFERNNYFHLKKENIFFFPQNTIASLDLQGKIINKEPDEIFQAPNGNGGCFISMKNSKIINLCIERKIEFLNVIPIDNPISKVLDPFFIGITIAKGKAKEYQMAAKCVDKRGPSEPIGVSFNYQSKPMMMDYGDIPKYLAEMRNDEGILVYNAGNILNYLISVPLLNKVLLDDMKYEELISEFHISKKKIPCVQITNGEVCSNVINGIKFELFFHSIFQFADKDGLLLLQVDRLEEFAPVKNSNEAPNDNPRITRMMMNNLFRRWYQKAGGVIKESTETDSNKNILEISFLVSYDGENIFKSSEIPKEIELTSDMFLESTKNN